MLIVGGPLAAVVGGFVLVSALAVHSVAREPAQEGDLKEIRLGQNTRIYDKDGKLLGHRRGRDQPHRGRAASGSRRS